MSAKAFSGVNFFFLPLKLASRPFGLQDSLGKPEGVILPRLQVGNPSPRKEGRKLANESRTQSCHLWVRGCVYQPSLLKLVF